jgi:hypothetical protein
MVLSGTKIKKSPASPTHDPEHRRSTPHHPPGRRRRGADDEHLRIALQLAKIGPLPRDVALGLHRNETSQTITIDRNVRVAGMENRPRTTRRSQSFTLNANMGCIDLIRKKKSRKPKRTNRKPGRTVTISSEERNRKSGFSVTRIDDHGNV